MKKLLLAFAALLWSVVSFAQADDTPATDEWVVTVSRTDVELADFEYKMTPGEVQIGGQPVYSATIKLDVVGTNKPAKYAIKVNGFTAEGTEQAWSQQVRLQVPDEPMQVTVGAYAVSKGMRVVFSNYSYYIGNVNHRLLSYLMPTSDGRPSVCYFNAPFEKSNEFKPDGAIKWANNGDDFNFLTGNGNNCIVFAQNKVGRGVYIASLDYATAQVSITKAETIELPIVESAPRVAFRPFVCAADVIIPDGLWVYTLTYDPAKPAELKAVPYEMTGRVLPANTPVILKASVKSIWTGDTDVYSLAIVPDSYDYKLDNGGVSPTYIYDSKTEGNVLVGVNQPHLVPEGAYMLHDMVYMPKTDGEIVHQFDCYVQLPDTGVAVADETDGPDTDPYLSINFPVEDEDAVITGVDAISIDVPATDTPAYDIYGRRVAPGYRGIVIRGGKKLYQN